VVLSIDDLGRRDDWSGVRAVVAGFGVSGFAAADNLTHLGASVIALDESPTGKEEKAQLLGVLGADIRLGDGTTAVLPDAVDLLVVSPGWKPSAPLIEQARARGIPVWGEVELAWRLRDPDHAAPWLAVTGTNGKTTTVQMLDSILRAAGLRSLAVGNVGLPIVEAVMDPTPYDVFAVELSSFQLHYTESMRAQSAAVLNVAPDHLDWYDAAGLDFDAGMADYAADKGRIYRGVRQACVYNVADLETERLVREADVEEGARAVGFTLGMPSVGMVGVVDDLLVDRAFIAERQSSAAELCTVADLASPAPHVVANALAAAALARAHGISQAAVRDGLRGFHPDGHRIATVATTGPAAHPVTWVDDSKATNPHAALSSLLAFDPVVWIAGGLAKGARFDDLVAATRDRLRGVVLLGRDRDVIAGALARHAPDVPVIVVDGGETGSGHAAMERAVVAAADLAQPGDTVLLAPGCASMDMFTNYADRGDAFAAAVQRQTDD
jgi:UDP-N-acetylmuramoylalanine--D-glutamate ligase